MFNNHMRITRNIAIYQRDALLNALMTSDNIEEAIRKALAIVGTHQEQMSK